MTIITSVPNTEFVNLGSLFAYEIFQEFLHTEICTFLSKLYYIYAHPLAQKGGLEKR